MIFTICLLSSGFFIISGSLDLMYGYYILYALTSATGHQYQGIKLLNRHYGETGGSLILHFRGNGIVYHCWINNVTSWFCSAGD